MTTDTSSDLTMTVEEKEIASRAATLLASESRITMSNQDFQAFSAALNRPFTPNAALQNALKQARALR
jgi:uncharacterized protein (DUF1778 family)